MPLLRLVFAPLLALLLLVGGSGVCAPMVRAETAKAPAPACHGAAHAPAGAAGEPSAQETTGREAAGHTAPSPPDDAPGTCLRCPLCATVVPAVPRLASVPQPVPVAFVRAVPSAPAAPPAEPSTPPPRA